MPATKKIVIEVEVPETVDAESFEKKLKGTVLSFYGLAFHRRQRKL